MAHVAAVLALVGGVASSARPVACGPAASSDPTTDERVSYWIDRLVRGPEPSPLSVPNLHQAVLVDAQRNLVAASDDTLARLADAALRTRVQSLHDINPWLGILGVLARIGPRRPDVARAWASPAVDHEQLLLRREGLAALVVLRDPADGPQLLRAFRRDPGDRMIGPTAIKALLYLGPPWDAEAARGALEHGVADLAEGLSSAWEGLLPAADEMPGGPRDDVVAWWALISTFAGPRGFRAHGRGASETVDTTVVFPIDHGLTNGRVSAAYAHVLLARRGYEAALASLRDDAASTDPKVREVARRGLVPSDADRAKARDAAASLVVLLKANDPSTTSDDVAAAVDALRDDPDPRVAEIVELLLRAIPRSHEWRKALFVTFRELRRRGVEPTLFVNELLRSGDPSHVDLALAFIREAKDPVYIDLVEAFLADPRGSLLRRKVRRELVYLYGVASMGSRIDRARVAAFVPRLSEWIADPDDPSAAGLASALLDLGPEGEAAFARGLSSPLRDAYVGALAQVSDRYVGREVAEALIAGVDASTPPDALRQTFAAIFASASSDAAPALARAVTRLRPPARDEAEALLRVVRHRVTPPR